MEHQALTDANDLTLLQARGPPVGIERLGLAR